jgi:hypothetical protein
MNGLHRLTISAPDGIGRNAVVSLDGREIHPVSVTLRCHADEVISAVIEFGALTVDFDGLADVVAKLPVAAT